MNSLMRPWHFFGAPPSMRHWWQSQAGIACRLEDIHPTHELSAWPLSLERRKALFDFRNIPQLRWFSFDPSLFSKSKLFDHIKSITFDDLPPIIDDMSIGKRIQGARLDAGYEKPIDLARATGISKQTISNYENDKVTKPDPATIVTIARATRVTCEWIVTGEGKPQQSPSLSETERKLLSIYNSMPEDKQASLLNYAEFLNGK